MELQHVFSGKSDAMSWDVKQEINSQLSPTGCKQYPSLSLFFLSEVCKY
jgi:hypothetical protein